MQPEKKDIAAVKKSIRKTMIIFGSLFMLAGLFTLVGGVYHYIQAVISNTWSSTSGVILESKIISSDDISVINGKSAQTKSWQPKIRYQYKIGDTMYENDRIRFSAVGGSDINISSTYTNMFPEKAKIKVWYSPLNKNKSVLIKGVDKATNYGAIIAGILFFSIGLLFYKLRNVYANSIAD